MRHRNKNSCWSASTLQKLTEIAENVRISSGDLIRYGDQLPEHAFDLTGQTGLQCEYARMQHALANLLYQVVYMNVKPKKTDHQNADEDLLSVLQKANTSLGTNDSGWVVCEVREDQLVKVKRNDNIRIITTDQLANYGQEIKVDQIVTLRRDREDFTSQPGFYYAFGDTLGSTPDEIGSARIYLCIRYDEAAEWYRHITTQLNRYQIPFHVKILRYPSSYQRTDRCVLYISRTYILQACTILVSIARNIGGLDSYQPFLTKPIYPGISIADDPLGSESFGMNRMRVIAEGILRAHLMGRKNAAEIVEIVTDNFRYCGFSPAKPWLNPSSADFDRLPIVHNLNHDAGKQYWPSKDHSGDWLDVADRIGTTLLRQAIWSSGQCAWMGWKIIGAEKIAIGREVLDQSFYDGSAGIALSLAYLYLHTQDAAYRHTALGAMKRVMTQTEKQPLSVGGYTGIPGIIFSAVHIAQQCHDQELLLQAEKLLHRLSKYSPMVHEIDVLSGRAGGIIRLLAVADLLPEYKNQIVDMSKAYGDDLLYCARLCDDTMSWTTLPGTEDRNLLGFSHGTAGIGWAMHRLALVSGEEKYAQAAHKTYLREGSFFCHEFKNWPDWRERYIPVPEAHNFMCAWCHGAPGSLISLVNYLADQPDDTLEKVRDAALETLVSDVSQIDDKNFCLCHGIAGNADILYDIGTTLGRPEYHEVVLGSAQLGADMFAHSGAWPCRGPYGGGQMLNLMTGLAGVAYFYLRRHDSTIPSVLLN